MQERAEQLSGWVPGPAGLQCRNTEGRQPAWAGTQVQRTGHSETADHHQLSSGLQTCSLQPTATKPK